MLIITAPDTDDPRENGFNHANPGELLIRSPIICDAGRRGDCGCACDWSGVASRKGTTLALVVERDIDPDTYFALIVDHLTEVYEVDQAEAEQEAHDLAEMAAEFGEGTYLTIDLADEEEGQIVTPLENADG